MNTTDDPLAKLASELSFLAPYAVARKQQFRVRAACSTLCDRWAVQTVPVGVYMPPTRHQIAVRCIELLDAIDLVRPLQGGRRDVQRVLYAALVRERDRVTTPAPLALAS